MVAGGNKLDHYYDAGSPITNLLETKFLLNSVLSNDDKEDRFMSCNLKYFFLATHMVESKYMRIHIKDLPPDIIKHYNVTSLFHNDYVYCKIERGSI